MAEVFVFGSNLAGRHGKGAALHAVTLGAVNGIGEGRMGDTYALPTKDHRIRTLPLDEIERRSVPNFFAHARAHPRDTFRLTPVGCGLAGYTPEQIAPMFRHAPSNVILPPEFLSVLEPSTSILELEKDPVQIISELKEEIRNLTAQRDAMATTRDAARANFLLMQQSAEALLRRSEKAEAELERVQNLLKNAVDISEDRH